MGRGTRRRSGRLRIRGGETHLLLQSLLQPRAHLVALLHHRGDVRLPRVKVVEVLPAVVAAEALLDGGGEGVEEGALAQQVARDPVPPRHLPPEVAARDALAHQRVLGPIGDQHPRRPPAPRRLQLDAGFGLRGARGLRRRGLRVELRLHLGERAFLQALKPAHLCSHSALVGSASSNGLVASTSRAGHANRHSGSDHDGECARAVFSLRSSLVRNTARGRSAIDRSAPSAAASPPLPALKKKKCVTKIK